MRIRNIKNADELIYESPYLIKNPYIYIGEYKTKVFKNNNPIHLEIGMGKGNFIIDMAKNNPDINFIGVEKYSSITLRALRKLKDINLPNLKIINIDALELSKVFKKEISTIYLNFSDPWPKKRHHKRRLTSEIFLRIYDDICLENIIIQKTDNIGLFESSIVSLSTYGYKIVDISLDLWSTEKVTSETEYENKFRKQGIKINYLKAIKK